MATGDDRSRPKGSGDREKRSGLAASGARHPIGVVEARTGLPQDVIRVWERRYGAVEPGRGSGGQRFYTDEDIQRLTLLEAATKAGRRIGSIATLPIEELEQMVHDDAAAIDARRASAGRAGGATLGMTLPDHSLTAEAESLVSESLVFARALDPERLDASLRRAATRLGIPTFIELIAAPVLRCVGDEWHAGRLSPAQEHVASTVMRDIIANAMRTMSANSLRAMAAGNGSGGRLLVATPAGERHEIGAALAGATAAAEGWIVIYLGADLAADEIARAAMSADVSMVALSVVYGAERDRLIEELRTLRAKLPRRVPVIIGGAGAAAIRDELVDMGIIVADSLSELRAKLREED